MPTDNQAAKSYIEAVMARADGATGTKWYVGGFARSVVYCRDFEDGEEKLVADCGHLNNGEANAEHIAASRQDIQTLAKMLLRAIAGLNEMRIRNSWAANVHADELLAEINAMAKGSQ